MRLRVVEPDWPGPCYLRRLRLEPLEDRRLLAITVDTLADAINATDGVTSLREAIAAANTIPGTDTVNFAEALTGSGPAAILLTHGELLVTQSLVIDGPGASLLTIDASGNDPTPDMNNGDGSRVFRIDDSASTSLDVEINGLRLMGGDVTGSPHWDGSGGAIYTRESLTLRDAVITGNYAAWGGGGVFAYVSERVEIISTIITGNESGAAGGGMRAHSGGEFVLRDSVVTGNHAVIGGGVALYQVHEADWLVENTTIAGNEASQAGGGIHLRTKNGGFVEFSSSLITGNTAGTDGGGVYAYARGDDEGYGSFTLRGLTVTNNFADRGAGLFLQSYAPDLVSIENSIIARNTAGSKGGGAFIGRVDDSFFIHKGTFAIQDTRFANNISSGAGGGIMIRDSDVSLISSVVSGNSALGGGGGGIYSVYNDLSVTSSTISANSSSNGGGGIMSLSDEHLEIVSSTISGNRTQGTAAGLGFFSIVEPEPVGLPEKSLVVRHSTITNNQGLGTFARGGGLVLAGRGTAKVEHTIIAGNRQSFAGHPPESDISPPIFWINLPSLTISYSLVGHNNAWGLTEAPVGSPDSNGNLIGGPTHGAIDPLLGPLADNGGSTMTHALLIDSPAIDAGDPAAVAGTGVIPLYDQRGGPFTRVVDGNRIAGPRIDIGAFELPPVAPTLVGDYNQNGTADAADYVVWRKMLGTSGVIPYSSADGNGDGNIIDDDYDVWTTKFGESVPPGAGTADVARSKSATGLENPTAATTSFSDAQGVQLQILNLAQSIPLRTRPPLITMRVAPVGRDRLDLLLINSTAANPISDWPDSWSLTFDDSSPYDDAAAIDDAFRTLDDWLI